ncbi:MAG: inorganic phosphate transporter [Promethearchaeota archaeon]|nr:MAG: inorganic phosphate transporter [Candidatus Lokiarchaeota archaeon]
MAEAIILVVFILISIFISFAIGGNDETFATVHGSKILYMKEILILATILAIAGAFFLGRSVSETIGKDLLQLPSIDNALVMTILISTAIWLTVSSALGLPISTTHATVGSIIGVGILLGGITGVNWITILEMSIWWLLSPVIGYIVTYFVYKLINKYIMRKLSGFKDVERSEKIFSYIILGVICWTAFSRAGNDCSNAVGILVGVGLNVNFVLIVTGISLAGGIIVLGRGVIKSVGNITELMPSTAFASEIPTSIILFLGTILGIPLSGSHMLVASLVGLSKARRVPTKKGLWKIVAVWLLTFPMAAIVGICIYFPLNFIF